MTFGHWRQQIRLLAALERLAGGEAVTIVALECGYESPSSFIAMFRRALGVTPGKYFGSADALEGGRQDRSTRPVFLRHVFDIAWRPALARSLTALPSNVVRSDSRRSKRTN